MQQNQVTNEPNRLRNQLSGTQIMFAAILMIGLVLAVQFSSRIDDDQALQDVQRQVQQEIELLRNEQSRLLNELEFVRSDSYVETWARGEGKMVQEGEVLVIPVPSGISIEEDSTPPQPSVALLTTEPDPEPWQLWWELFFDQPPPRF